nr:hypothetical protein Itr_chr02CG05120 [Ipomoea trifida]
MEGVEGDASFRASFVHACMALIILCFTFVFLLLFPLYFPLKLYVLVSCGNNFYAIFMFSIHFQTQPYPFAPPTFSIEEFAEYQEHLVKPEEEQLREIEAEERAAAGERVVLDVDLNVEVAPVEEFILPDLNLPPPDED